MTARKTLGFGVPDDIDPHHFTVEIPPGREKPVVVTEHYGLRGGFNGTPESVERCRLSRAMWGAIADETKRVLNERLKEKGLSTSRWSAGNNKVERLLGRELCVLAWGVETAQKELVPNAIRNWVALRPDERWWLFSMAANMTGAAEDVDVGWRKAIRIALTENPTGEEVAAIRAKRPKVATDTDRPRLPLFEDR